MSENGNENNGGVDSRNHNHVINGFSSGDVVDNPLLPSNSIAVNSTITFLDNVLASPESFAAAHSSFVREIGRELPSRITALNTIIEWALGIQGNSNMEQYIKKADTAAKTLQQLFVRYHGLAPDSPYGPCLFDNLRQHVQNDFRLSEMKAIYSINLCLATCELILGHEASLLDDCVNTLEKLMHLLEDSRVNEVPGSQQILTDCLHVLNRFENLLSTAPTRGPFVSHMFINVRNWLIHHKLPAGEISEIALNMLEKRAARHFASSNSIHVNGFVGVEEAIFADYCSMDEEAEADYEKFLEECT